MPVCLHSGRISSDPTPPSGALSSQSARQLIRIGLINSMPGAAFKATEDQFLSLLNSASEDLPIQLSLFVLRGAQEIADSQNHLADRYRYVDELWGQHLDGLIVTGTEPLSASLKDEPYWESFTRLLDWARENTHSTIWSCLAAHAAILHMDGIERRRNSNKHFGIFQCHRVSEDRLLEGTASHFSIPHSRWNGVSEQDLQSHGYRVLTRTADAEVDLFTKQDNSLFVFFQGHPEYATDTLLREYRRDIGRSLRDPAHAYPHVPHGYFDPASGRALSALRETASEQRRDQLLADIASAMESVQIENTWRNTAARIYKNWLEHLCACKDATLPHGNADAPQAACQ